MPFRPAAEPIRPAPPVLPARPGPAGLRPGQLLRPALVLAGLLVAGLLLRLLPGGGLPGAGVLRQGLDGRLLFLLVGSAVCAVGMPRQAVCFAAGLAYGFWEAVALSTLATLLGCLACLFWVRLGGRGRSGRRSAGGAGRWRVRMERTLAARPFATILTLRLLPVGSSLALNVVAGLLGVAVLPFVAATVLGSLPQTVIFTLLGGGTRIGHGTQTALAVALFIASGALGLVLLRRSGHD